VGLSKNTVADIVKRNEFLSPIGIIRSTNVSNLKVLDGLPTSGPGALPFPEDGRGSFREGLVVRFYKTAGSSWVGNFQRGFAPGFDCVIHHPDGRHVIVIAGGEGYFIDPESQRQTHTFGGGINFVQHVPNLNIVVVGDGIHLAAFSADGSGWSSERISWDGMRNIAIIDSILQGEAWSPVSDTWHPFQLDLLTGKSLGAIYPK
jgi:hypothetical protein